MEVEDISISAEVIQVIGIGRFGLDAILSGILITPPGGVNHATVVSAQLRRPEGGQSRVSTTITSDESVIFDADGRLRIHTADPGTDDTLGTVVGTQ